MPGLLVAARSVAAVLVVANLLIICHELGHLWTARRLGVHARRFSIGFGPTLARHVDRHGTIWSLSLLPLAGFVSFDGEKDPASQTSYASKRPLARMAIIAAGPVANVLVAILTFALMLALFGKPSFLPVVSTIVPDSAAERAGFHLNDRVVAIGGITVNSFEDMRPSLRDNPGKVVAFLVERDGHMLDLFAAIGVTEEAGKRVGLLGIRSTVPFVEHLSPEQILQGAIGKTWGAMSDTLNGIGTVLTSGQGTENIAGVVGIAQLAGEVAQQGPGPFLALVAILSANLALMNLLPIPVLDGGALLFCLAELALRRPLPARVQDFGTRAGLALLMTLFMITTAHDIYQAGLLDWLARL